MTEEHAEDPGGQVAETTLDIFPPAMFESLWTHVPYPARKICLVVGLEQRVLVERLAARFQAVVGLEANDERIMAAEVHLRKHSNFSVVRGSQADTGLEDGSIDLIVLLETSPFQLHYSVSKEFRRILRRRGLIAWIGTRFGTAGSSSRLKGRELSPVLIRRFLDKAPDLYAFVSTVEIDLEKWFKNRTAQREAIGGKGVKFNVDVTTELYLGELPS